jgi:hypothetical protein
MKHAAAAATPASAAARGVPRSARSARRKSQVARAGKTANGPSMDVAVNIAKLGVTTKSVAATRAAAGPCASREIR